MTRQAEHPLFVSGAIPPDRVGELVASLASNPGAGGHALFLGQVRADEASPGEVVTAIDYSAHEAMARREMERIRTEVVDRHGLEALHVLHSLGRVEVGGLCLLVLASAAHRGPARDACRDVVEALKARLPIFGRELLGRGGGHRWKENTSAE